MNTSTAPLGSLEWLISVSFFWIFTLFTAIPFWFICKKAGLSPWLSLIMLIPFGVIILPPMLAFMDWPALKKNDR